jgi:hypothetical protein
MHEEKEEKLRQIMQKREVKMKENVQRKKTYPGEGSRNRRTLKTRKHRVWPN